MARSELLDTHDLSWIEALLRDSSTWALVNEFARPVVAVLARRDLSVLDTLDRWVGDDVSSRVGCGEVATDVRAA